jgi:hypothetical protein
MHCRFPKDDVVAGKWISFCRLQEHEVYVSNRICSDHFTEDDFIDNRAGGGIRVLKKGCIPSIRKKKERLVSKYPCLIIFKLGCHKISVDLN